MSESTDLRNVTKFDGQKFQLWKFQMKTILVAHDLLKVVEGIEIKPEVHGDLRDAWIKKNAKAMLFVRN